MIKQLALINKRFHKNYGPHNVDKIWNRYSNTLKVTVKELNYNEKCNSIFTDMYCKALTQRF